MPSPISVSLQSLTRRRTERAQRGIRSSGQLTTISRFAQGWHGLEVLSREHLAAEYSVTIQRPGAEDTRCTLAGMRRVSEANEVQAEPDRVMAADAGSGAAVTLIASAGAPRRSRSLEERLIMRVPSSYRVGAALSRRLFRSDAWVRRRFVRHAVMSGWAAVQRRDFELAVMRYAPDVVFEADAGLQTLGIPGSARGRAEMARVLAHIFDVFDRFEIAPAAIVDLSSEPLIVVLGANRMHFPGSGLELEGEVAQVLTLERGLVARERDFARWDDALHAAGLDATALDLLRRR
jgi:hypothetical protein